MPMCSMLEYASKRLKSFCRAMNTAATAIDSSPMKIMIFPGELGFRCPGTTDLIDAQDRQKCATGDAAGQQGSHDARRFAVGVRLPGVHRRQAHLGAVTDEEQHKCRVEPLLGGGKFGRIFDQLVEEQRRFQTRLERGIGQEQRTEQRQGNAHGTDQQILPGRLQERVHCG